MAQKTHSRIRLPLPGRDYRAVWLATVALFVVSFFVAPHVLEGTSITALLNYSAVLMVVSAGQTIIVQQRGIDLSTPGAITLCAMVFPIVFTRFDAPIGVAILVTFVVGVCVGILNGLLVYRLGVTPLIVTLATNSILIGALLTFTNGLPTSSAPPELVDFASSDVLGIPMLFVVAVGYVLLLWVLSTQTATGRRFVAVGVNPMAARAAGIPVGWYVVGAYIVGGISSALGSILLLGYVQSATFGIGAEYLFASIAAVVVGGTSFGGGRGSVIATAVAAIFLTQLVQLLLASGAPSAIQLLAQALAIALAVALRTAGPAVVARLRPRPLQL